MPSQTNEQALEALIEKHLTGTCLEELKEQGIPKEETRERAALYRGGNGFFMGVPEDYNVKYAIDEYRFWNFLQNTQSEELDKLKRSSDWKLKILERLDRMVKKNGILSIFKKGLGVDNAHFVLFYPLPLASSSQSIRLNFESNEFSVTRQVRYNTSNQREEIDMVLFINGLSFASMELKNHWTGQSAKIQGQNQYKTKRDNTQALLTFGRCLVHFTADTEEVYMTTRLSGKDTFFFPFNKGQKDGMGKGNPPNPFGHKTDYLWKDVLSRESIANLIQHFIRFDGDDKVALKNRTLFFPRYHQLNVVRRLIADSSKKGIGETYLIQHSAGSGKSNSITWASFQLIETYPENETVKGSRGIDKPLFDSVIVVTDRRLLDKQIHKNIKAFSEVKNIVGRARSSKELKEHMENGKRIIISTIQKFPFIVDGIADMSDKRFAVVIDEAHSSQSGTGADNLNRAMNKKEEEEVEDVQDRIVEAMKSRKISANASYFAFTATPKENTLERFGIKQADGTYKEFDLYSMKQAIEEGFILDVVSNYTTYRSYYQIQKSVEDNPLFDTVKAQKKLRKYVERHKQTVAIKAEVMLEHFISNIISKKKLKGKAKGMVVTQSIESAILYYFAIKQLLKDRGEPFKVIVAFSGKKTVNGIEYTEESINNLPAALDTAKSSAPDYISDKIARFFDMDPYRLLIVANKYLTGFDQPKLTAMYVDKKLQGLLAVQALSRLNRSSHKLAKRTEDLFVLDFFNATNDIKTAFDKFYTTTILNAATDVNVLHELKAELDDVGIYEWSEVEYFVEQYFNNVSADQLSGILAIPVHRFDQELELEDNERADFKIKAKQFVKIYGQMAAILPYEMIKWEKLFWFLKFLIPKLIITTNDGSSIEDLLDSVDLSTYGLERVRLNEKIELDDSETELDPQNPNPRSAHGGERTEEPIDLIIATFNERWFDGWDATPEEQRIKFVNLAQSMRAHKDFQEKYANNEDAENREIAFVKIFEEVMGLQRRKELDLYRKVSKDESFKIAMMDTIRRILNASM